MRNIKIRVKIFVKADSTFVDSKADVSMKLKLRFSANSLA
jgi:hypothetical protein